MGLDQAMKTKTILVLSASLCASAAFGQAAPRPDPATVIASQNSSMLIKMTSGEDTRTSKVGDPVTGELIDPSTLRGATVEGKIDRADHDVLAFSFDVLHIDGRTFPIQSKIVSVTSSAGNEGRDDLNQRIRIEGAGIIAYGVSTALNEGAEVRITAWKR
jgi:hypothetical protein